MPVIAAARRLTIDARGVATPARQVVSPNRDQRPPGTDVTLLVVHGISLPPGEFGGDAIIDLFTNRLDPAGPPVLRDDRRRLPSRRISLSGATAR